MKLQPRVKRRIAVIPTDRQLQIDLDSKRAYAHFRNRLNFFRARLRAYRSLAGWRIKVKTSRSINGNHHITITFSQRMTILERICAQALLGSDPNREMYNFFRYLNGSRFPVLFFEKVNK